nr:hypothetical protein [Anaerolineae bacterium]
MGDDWDDWGEEGWTMMDDLTVETDPEIYVFFSKENLDRAKWIWLAAFLLPVLCGVVKAIIDRVR